MSSPEAQGRVVLITGAAGGLGRALAEAFAGDGADLALCDIDPGVRDLAAQLPATAGRVVADVVDIGEAGQVQAFVDKVTATYGRIDVLINNAAEWKETPVLADWDSAVADFERLVNVNARGPFLFTRLCAPALSQGEGNIVNVTADDVMPYRREGTNPPTTDVFNATKWSLNSLTQSWNLALGSRGVRVNGLAIGPTDTATGRKMFGESVTEWLKPEAVASLVLDLIREGPDGRRGENVGAWPGYPLELGPRKPAHRAMTG